MHIRSDCVFVRRVNNFQSHAKLTLAPYAAPGRHGQQSGVGMLPRVARMDWPAVPRLASSQLGWKRI